MKKQLVAIALALAYTVSTAMVAAAFTCEVVSADGKEVTMKCKASDAGKLKVGKKVKVKVK